MGMIKAPRVPLSISVAVLLALLFGWAWAMVGKAPSPIGREAGDASPAERDARIRAFEQRLADLEARMNRLDCDCDQCVKKRGRSPLLGGG